MNAYFFKIICFIIFSLSISLYNTCVAQAATNDTQATTAIQVYYTVQPGDTLSEIAKYFDMDVEQLIQANNLQTIDIKPCQILTITSRQNFIKVNSTSNTLSSINDKEDLIILARAIYAEARGESFEGQVAIGAVVLNRTRDPHFPDSIREVVFQRNHNLYQFSPVADGSINLTPDETAILAATRAMEGYDPTNGALFFYNPRTASDKWIKTLPVITTIGSHNFATKA